MKASVKSTVPQPDTAYGGIYEDTRSMIRVLSGMTEATLKDEVVELQTDYEIFLSDYHGPDLVDDYVGFGAMLHHRPFPRPALEGSALNGLTIAQFFLVWAWNQNDAARYFLGGAAVAHDWKPDEAMKHGVVAAVSAAKSLIHAKSLLASGDGKLGQKVA